MPFKNLNDTTTTKNETHNLRQKIAAARSIVVAGAGLTGVEVAGELEALNVKIMTHTRVMSATTTPTGKRVLDLGTGGKNNNEMDMNLATTILETNLYIQTFGVRPNTAFVPAAMLDLDGRVKVDKKIRYRPWAAPTSLT